RAEARNPAYEIRAHQNAHHQHHVSQLHAPEENQLSPLVSLRALAAERPFTLFCMEIRAVLALSHGAPHPMRAHRAWSEMTAYACFSASIDCAMRSSAFSNMRFAAA